MNTEAQIRYIEEVLGISADAFLRNRQTQAAFKTLVLVQELSAEAQDLLQKILGSIQLTDFILSDREHPEARHVIKFDSAVPGGRQMRGNQVWWILPSLNEMLGNSPEVSAKKKTAWTVLQQLKKELV